MLFHIQKWSRKFFNSGSSASHRRPLRKRRPLHLECLEDRITPATLRVHDLTTMISFPTIQAAVNAANPGDTILADAGTYAENVTINKSLILEGAQHGHDAATRFAAFTTGGNGPKADTSIETVLTAPTVNPTPMPTTSFACWPPTSRSMAWSSTAIIRA